MLRVERSTASEPSGGTATWSLRVMSWELRLHQELSEALPDQFHLADFMRCCLQCFAKPRTCYAPAFVRVYRLRLF